MASERPIKDFGAAAVGDDVSASEPLFSAQEWWRTLTRRYRCATCNADVRPGDRHEHGCPLADYIGERCSERRCNRTGRCQR